MGDVNINSLGLPVPPFDPDLLPDDCDGLGMFRVHKLGTGRRCLECAHHNGFNPKGEWG